MALRFQKIQKSQIQVRNASVSVTKRIKIPVIVAENHELLYFFCKSSLYISIDSSFHLHIPNNPAICLRFSSLRDRLLSFAGLLSCRNSHLVTWDEEFGLQSRLLILRILSFRSLPAIGVLFLQNITLIFENSFGQQHFSLQKLKQNEATQLPWCDWSKGISSSGLAKRQRDMPTTSYDLKILKERPSKPMLPKTHHSFQRK